MKSPESQLAATFNRAVSEALADAVKRSYDAAICAHDPRVGHDGMSFGLLVYKSKVHFLGELAERHNWIVIEQKAPFFRFRIGPFHIASYCAGHTLEANEQFSFPGNRTRAGKLVEANESLWLPGMQPDYSACRELVLNDIGDADTGLMKLFVGIPVEKADDNRITKWGATFMLWSRDVAASREIKSIAPVEKVTRFRPQLKVLASDGTAEE